MQSGVYAEVFILLVDGTAEIMWPNGYMHTCVLISCLLSVMMLDASDDQTHYCSIIDCHQFMWAAMIRCWGILKG